jgi:cytochrome c
MSLRLLALALPCVTAACIGGRALPPYAVVTGGDPARGEVVIRTVRCGACHTIPGVHGANGVVGPPLASLAQRTYIAGQWPNTPSNLVRWLRDPPALAPNTAMPNLRLSEQQARDIAAYLYSQS